MSVCKNCGKDIRWAKREDGRNHPPLEYVGRLLMVDDDNVVREVTGYVRHTCSDEDMAAWNTAVNQETAQRLDYLEAVQRAQEASRAVVCRRCNSDVNVACKNLHERRKGHDVDTIWPHAVRLQDVGWQPETVGAEE